MELSSSRKFNTDFRKKLIAKFEKLKDKVDYITIYYIIIEDIGTNFSSNRNGIFINMNLLSDKCIEKLHNFMNEKAYIINKQSNVEVSNYNFYKADDIEIVASIGHKLSNHDKHIIKKIRNNVI